MGLSSRTEFGEAVGMTWQRPRPRSQDRAARLLQAAERDAEAAAARYQALREAAAAPVSAHVDGAARRPVPTWQQLLLLVLGGGSLAGLLVMWLLAAAYVGPSALLVLPAAGGLAAGLVVLRRRRPKPVSRRRPVVADLVRAAQEMHAAEAALHRLRTSGTGIGGGRTGPHTSFDNGTGRGLHTIG
jgi:hypothetical protein